MQQLILISNPTPVPDETNIINELFEEGLQLFHLRKPDYSMDDVMRLIDNIQPAFHERIVLPAGFLKNEIKREGIGKKLHFFEYLRKETASITFSMLRAHGYVLSTSIHEAETYETLSQAFDYTFFGPVFDSISKRGYSAISKTQLKVLQQKRVTKMIALGGISEDNCSKALAYGFDGVAVLGAVWQSEHPVPAFKKIQTCIMKGQSS